MGLLLCAVCVSSSWLSVVDGMNRPVGADMEHSWVHHIGVWHRVARVWVTDGMNRTLVQRTGMCMWGPSAEVHIRSGETPEMAALRELREALYITADTLSLVAVLRKSYSYHASGIDNREFVYVFHAHVGPVIPCHRYIEESTPSVSDAVVGGAAEEWIPNVSALAWVPFSDLYVSEPELHMIYETEFACHGVVWKPNTSEGLIEIAEHLPKC